MKKLLLFASALLAVNLFAGEENAPLPADDYTNFGLGFFMNQPSSMVNSNVYGIKAGFPICNGLGRVYGIEASWLYSGTAYIKGIQGSWVLNRCKTIEGVQGSWIGNINDEWFKGVQAALAFDVAGNMTGLQAGSVVVADDYLGLQAGVFASVARRFGGLQTSVITSYADDFGGIQFTGLVNVADDVSGLQVAGYNSARNVNGLQFGVMNVANGNQSFQLGLINIIKDGPIPFMPLINFNW
ncbi:MAG: hypothetical protein PHI85_08595 [Victivallaceae bacterium]|nr:hypothetical protein [Victivallaceae bacterium]